MQCQKITRMVRTTKTVKLKYPGDIRMNNGSDIATLYSLEGIIAMDDVREDEKNSCRDHPKEVVGFIEIKIVPYKLFLDMDSKEVEEV